MYDKNELLNKLEDLFIKHEKFKNAYFFNPPQAASMRRSYEKRNSTELIEWNEGDTSYSAKFTVECSCKNVYAHGSYYKAGKKTTLTAIKNSYTRMKEA